MKRYPYIVAYVVDKIERKLLKVFLISIKIAANIPNKRTKSFLKLRQIFLFSIKHKNN